jgi:hypothetical protein
MLRAFDVGAVRKRKRRTSGFEEPDDLVDAVLLVFIEIGPPGAELVGVLDPPR